jgi:hypothetical protein
MFTFTASPRVYSLPIPLRDAVKVCTFEKIREPTTAEKS